MNAYARMTKVLFCIIRMESCAKGGVHLNSKRMTFSIPIMVIVGIAALWMLNRGYSEIDLSIRILIALGAVLLSGGISYFLFPNEEGK